MFSTKTILSPLVRSSLPLIALCASGSLAFSNDLWVNNFEKAKATAKAEGKDLLMDFTGSDWCGWCIRLHKEVFDLEAFKQAAPKKFVLLELDYPQSKELPKDIKAQNDRLQADFRIQGFPTILLADASGKPYAKTGYREGGAETYLKHLEELQAVRLKRDELWTKAESVSGVEKAKLLADGLKVIDAELVAAHYKSVIDQIQGLDPKDETGIGAELGFKGDLEALSKSLGELLSKGDKAALRPALDQFLQNHPKATKAQKQEALFSLLSFYRPPADNQVALELMQEITKIDSTSPIGERAAGIAKRIEQMISAGSSKKDPASKGDPNKGESK